MSCLASTEKVITMVRTCTVRQATVAIFTTSILAILTGTATSFTLQHYSGSAVALSKNAFGSSTSGRRSLASPHLAATSDDDSDADAPVDLSDVGFVLLAGGTGSRMKANMPKQFLELMGRPVLHHSLDLFLERLPDYAEKNGLRCVRSQSELCDLSTPTSLFAVICEVFMNRAAFRSNHANIDVSLRLLT